MKKLIFVLALALISINDMYSQSCIGNFDQNIKYSHELGVFDPPSSTGIDLPVNDPEYSRLVYWMHGLDGDYSSWIKAAQASEFGITVNGIPNGNPSFPARKLKSVYNITYFQGADVNTAATHTFDFIREKDDDSVNIRNGIHYFKDNFVIAHSQGGIVSRTVDRFMNQPGYDARFGGIATFGTPHQGAKGINNKEVIKQIGADVCAATLNTTTANLIYENSLLKILFPIDFAFKLDTLLCNFGAFKILPAIAGGIEADIQLDYAHNAPFLEGTSDFPNSGLNDYPSTMQKAVFYGIESAPQLYKVMYNLMVKKPNEFPTFQADDDQPIVKAMEDQQKSYVGRVLQLEMDYENEKDNIPWSCIVAQVSFFTSVFAAPFAWLVFPLGITTSTICAIQGSAHTKKLQDISDLIDIYKKAENTMANVNDRYLHAIGAMQFVDESYNLCRCETMINHRDEDIIRNFRVSTPAECDQIELDIIKSDPKYVRTQCGFSRVISTKWIELPNDGVVPAYSAGDWQGAKAFQMLGSNHQQMRNDRNTKEALLNLYENKSGVLQFFKTDTK